MKTRLTYFHSVPLNQDNQGVCQQPHQQLLHNRGSHACTFDTAISRDLFQSNPACETPHCEVRSKHPTLFFAHLKLYGEARVLHRVDERFFRASCLVRARLGHDRNSHQIVFLVLGKHDRHSNQDAARLVTIRGEAPCAGT